jgi:uncharacterized membrane protein YhaH (DUF805 family)
MHQVKLEDILPHLWISGRSSRAEWWRVHMLCAVLVTVFDQMFIARLEQGNVGDDTRWVSLLWAVVSLGFGWVSFASVVRRFRDRGKAGWWALLYFLPGIGWLWILIECGFLPGKPAAAMPAAAPASAASRAAPPRPASASRTAARLQTAPRAGTVQRRGQGTWDSKRTLTLANGAVRLVVAVVAAFLLYRFAADPDTAGVFRSDIHRTQSQFAN